MRWTVPAALALHAAILALLLPQAGPLLRPADPPLLKIELVDQSAQTIGAPPTTAAAPAPPPQPVESPAPSDGDVPAPSPSKPEPPQPTAQPSAPTEVNLGNSDMEADPLSVTGDNVVPPRPDARFHNLPPGYPADAARRRIDGVVSLVVHVTAEGTAGAVEVARSSGTPSLDRAAHDAVAKWHFTPALSEGEPVPFDYPINIHFRSGE